MLMIMRYQIFVDCITYIELSVQLVLVESFLEIDFLLQYFVNYKLAPGSSEQNSTEAKTDEVYRNYFLNSLCFVAQVPNVALNGFNLFCRVKG